MDEADKAQQQVEKALQVVLSHVDTRPTVLATGYCLNCAEPLHPPQRWCDAACRDDWSKRRGRSV